MFVKPAPGLRVRDPHNPSRLVEPGEVVDETDLDWHRLIACGDLVESSQADADAYQADLAAERVKLVADIKVEQAAEVADLAALGPASSPPPPAPAAPPAPSPPPPAADTVKKA